MSFQNAVRNASCYLLPDFVLDFIKLYPIRDMTDEQQYSVEILNDKIANREFLLEDVRCIICGSIKKSVLFINDRYGIKCCICVCKDCGLVFMNPRFTDKSNYEFYSSDLYRSIYSNEEMITHFEKRYDYQGIDRNNSYHRLLFFDFIEQRIGNKYSTVLEIGAGGGWNLLPFIDIGKKCVGCEFSSRLVDLGKSKGIDLIQGGINAIKGKFDLIILRHVLEHFLSPIGQLMSISKYLTDKGYLFIEVPGFVDEVPSIQNAHTYYFSEEKLKVLLNLAGLKVIDHKVIKSNGYIFCLAVKENDCTTELSDEYESVVKIVRKFKVNQILLRIYKILRRTLPLGRTLS